MAIPPGPYRELVLKLAAKRRRSKIPQRVFDERLNIAGGLTGKWECGDRFPSPFLLCCWANELGCEITLRKIPTTKPEKEERADLQLSFAFDFPEKKRVRHR